jgi:hypothetical protein
MRIIHATLQQLDDLPMRMCSFIVHIKGDNIHCNWRGIQNVWLLKKVQLLVPLAYLTEATANLIIKATSWFVGLPDSQSLLKNA